MEQQKRGRGRPRIDATVTEVGAPSRRQAINAMYMLEGGAAIIGSRYRNS